MLILSWNVRTQNRLSRLCWNSYEKSRYPVELQSWHWHLDVVLGLAFAVLVGNGEALLLAILFLLVPVKELVDIKRVALPTVLRTKSVSWCTLVMNQVTEESWRMWCRGTQSRMEDWNTSMLILWCVWRCLKVRVDISWAFSHLMLELWEVLKWLLCGWTRLQSLIRLL